MTLWLTLESLILVDADCLPGEQVVYLLFNSDIVSCLLEITVEMASDLILVSLNCWWVDCDDMEQKLLFRAGLNRIFCVSRFIHVRVTQGGSKISSFYFWLLLIGSGVGSRFSYLTPVTERFSIDHYWAAKHRLCTFEVECGGVPRSWLCGNCNHWLN